MRAAVYCGSRNVYADMTPAAKSLARYSDVERIYFLIEDERFPEALPDYVTTINVSGQRFFRKDGPNALRRWTWMSLMRAALPKLLPDLDVILNIDIDTIAVQDVSALWDIELGEHLFAGVREPGKSGKYPYINYGVTLHNLKLLRETGTDDAIIRALNTKPYDCPMQDSLYEICGHQVLTIDPAYNVCNYTEQTSDLPKILHYAAVPCWEHRPPVEQYRRTPWNQIR